jgi:hypothetical protein
MSFFLRATKIACLPWVFSRDVTSALVDSMGVIGPFPGHSNAEDYKCRGCECFNKKAVPLEVPIVLRFQCHSCSRKDSLWIVLFSDACRRIYHPLFQALQTSHGSVVLAVWFPANRVFSVRGFSCSSVIRDRLSVLPSSLLIDSSLNNSLHKPL